MRLAEDPAFATRPAFRTVNGVWDYRHLADQARRIARVLVEDLGLVSGNRVLIRSGNNPMAVACWLGIVLAGGISVATMPLLRGGEIATIANRTKARLALCDARLEGELRGCLESCPSLERSCLFDGGESGAGSELELLMAGKTAGFKPVDTAADDIALIAFTSGTTGRPKGAMHAHSDIMAISRAFPRAVLKPTPEDIFIGTPPLAFTFGFGALVVFPLTHGASTVLLESPSPEDLLRAVGEFQATICLTVPTAYRAMLRALEASGAGGLERLRICASAGEALPLATYEAWLRATGLRIVDGIGSTEMLNHFISTPVDEIRPGATGKPLPGYEAMIVDENMAPLPPGEIGRLAVRGPTGCRYLDDPRQADYVVDGWNLTGDSFRMDDDGYFWFQARSDDMIVSSGYNIAGAEVEDALLHHDAVAECAIVAAPDPGRGHIVKAYVVLADGYRAGAERVLELQDFVKARIAPYKYPRAIEFIDELPKTQTGKIQRYRLREDAAGADPSLL